ncbi:MAG: hypothetical protein HZB25_12830 [Candidatus Eisenbacteria bacterium]|nr:hypothetical protein [Candidatus Eisenbacteria bacterium]
MPRIRRTTQGKPSPAGTAPPTGRGGRAPARPESPPSAPAPPLPAGTALVAISLALLLLPWLASRDSSNWTWGLNISGFLPSAWPLAARLAVLAAMAPGVAFALRSRSAVADRQPKTGPGRRAARPAGPPRGATLAAGALVCAAAAVALWMCREQVHFLGDTMLRLRTVYRMAVKGEMVPAWGLHAAPLDYLVNVVLPVRMSAAGLLTAFQAAQLVPCLLGALFVAAAMLAAPLSAATRPGRAIFLAAVLTQGYMQLFAGYCKGYGLLILLLLLWYAAVTWEDRSGRAAVWSTVLFGLVLLCHRTGLLLAPCQAWLVWKSRGRDGAWGAYAAAGLAGLCGAALVTGWQGAASADAALLGSVWRGAREAGDYPLLSATHAANVLNDLFLLAPFGLAGMLLLPVVRPGGPGLRALLLGGVPFLLLALLVRSLYPVQGAPRDWDNFASSGLFLTLLAARLAVRVVEGAPRLGVLAAAAVLAGAVHTATWLALNASPAAALERVERIGESAPSLPVSARAMLFDYLGQVRELANEPALAGEAYLRASDLAPNPRFFVLAGTQFFKAGRMERAAGAFRSAARRDPVTREKMLIVSGNTLGRNPADPLGLMIRAAALSVPGTPGTAAPAPDGGAPVPDGAAPAPDALAPAGPRAD